VKILCQPENRKYKSYRNAASGGPSRDHVQHAHKILVKFGRVGFEICKQIDKQTDILIAVYFALCRIYVAGGAIVRALTCDLRYREFDFRPFHSARLRL